MDGWMDGTTRNEKWEMDGGSLGSLQVIDSFYREMVYLLC